MIITLKHPFLMLSQELVEICKPLELLKLHHFSYQEHFNDGSKVSLSNKPKWVEDYYNLNLFQTSLFEGKPSTYKARYDIWYGDYDLEVYRHGKLYFNTAHAISIIEPQQDSCEFYLFSTAMDNHTAINYLARNIDILYHFVFYFRDKASKIVATARENKIIQPVCNNKLIVLDENEINREIFYSQTKIKKYYLKTNQTTSYITAREFDCLNLLAKGKSLKEIATILNLSPRTIGFYIDNIKKRLNCHTKTQLISLFLANISYF